MSLSSVMATLATQLSRPAAEILCGVLRPYPLPLTPGCLASVALGTELVSATISHYLGHSNCFFSHVSYSSSIHSLSRCRNTLPELQGTYFLLTFYTPSKPVYGFCCMCTFLLNGDLCLSEFVYPESSVCTELCGRYFLATPCKLSVSNIKDTR